MFSDLFNSLTNSNPYFEAEQLQIDQINIAFKKIELKIARVTFLQTATTEAMINLLKEKNIITEKEFSDEFERLSGDNNEFNKGIKALEDSLKDMEEKYNKKLAELNEKNKVYFDFLKTVYPDLYKEKFGDNEKEKKEDKDGE